MTTKTLFKDILTVIVLSATLTIFITRPCFSQDTTKTKPENKVRIVAKVIEDKNGKRQEFDTTINLDRNLKPGEEQEIMKNFEMKIKDLGDQMKNLEVEISDLNLPDSGMMDSIHGLTEKALKLKSGMGNIHFRHNFPKAFNYEYNFEMPDMDQQPQIEEFNDENAPEGMNESRYRIFKQKGESLNDLLGNIPMERVKSYSIKDTKDGKKIVIELKNGPIIENHKQIIIIHSPSPQGKPGQHQRQQIKKKIIINNGDQEQEEEQDKL